MQTKIRKWGNSLGLRIPKAFAEEASVGEGSTVDISVLKGKLVIESTQTIAYKLEELLAEVSKDNRHTEVFAGPAEGKEIW